MERTPLFLEYANDTGVVVGDRREDDRLIMGVGEGVLRPLIRSEEPGPGPVTRSPLDRCVGQIKRSAKRRVQRDSS